MAGNLFGKMAADTLGLSDIGKIISPKDFDKVDGDDYIMNEDGEKIYFVIKSKSDEYVFTNRGLLHGGYPNKKHFRKWRSYWKINDTLIFWNFSC